MQLRRVSSVLFGCVWSLGGVSLGIASGGCAPHRVASPPAANAPTHGITVSGVGRASGQPNVARTTIGVEVRAGTAEEAIAEVNARMARVIAAVKQAGVAGADVRTATLSLNFERNYEQPPHPVSAAPALAPAPAVAATGKARPAVATAESASAPPAPKLPQGFYTASNNVEVTIRKLSDAGKVITAATSAGADQLFGIRFELEDPSPLLVDARKKAVEDARLRAERLAQLAGVKLGPAVSITEFDGGNSPGPAPMFAAARNQAAAPIESGEVTVTSTVQIVYALPE